MPPSEHGCDQGEMTSAFALRALAADEMQEAEAHIATCADCQRELESLRPVIHSLVNWPQDMLQPSASLWDQLATRIAPEARGTPAPADRRWSEPEWSDVGPGISCKVLASDHEGNRSACWLAWRREPLIRRIAMPVWKSCTCSTASSGSTTESCVRAITIGRSQELQTTRYGARQAAPACSSPRRAILFFDDLIAVTSRRASA